MVDSKMKSNYQQSAAPPEKYEIPEFKPSSKVKGSIEAKICLASPVSKGLEFTMFIDEGTSFEIIREAIIRRHGGSIVDVHMCLNYYHRDECVDVTKQLKDYGITEGKCSIYYDFTPFSSALLAA